MRNLTRRWKQSGHFLMKTRTPIFNFRKIIGEFSPASCAPVLIWHNTKTFTLLESTAKMDNDYSSSKLTSSFFFICAIIYFHFFSKGLRFFNERIWHCITFYQLEGSCTNCNYFYQPYKTEGHKCNNRATSPRTDDLIYYLQKQTYGGVL